jgi:hypothetical protein
MPQPKTLEDKYRELLNISWDVIRAYRNGYRDDLRSSIYKLEGKVKRERDLGNQGQNKNGKPVATLASRFGNSNQQIKIQL